MGQGFLALSQSECGTVIQPTLAPPAMPGLNAPMFMRMNRVSMYETGVMQPYRKSVQKLNSFSIQLTTLSHLTLSTPTQKAILSSVC